MSFLSRLSHLAFMLIDSMACLTLRSIPDVLCFSKNLFIYIVSFSVVKLPAMASIMSPILAARYFFSIARQFFFRNLQARDLAQGLRPRGIIMAAQSCARTSAETENSNTFFKTALSWKQPNARSKSVFSAEL